MVSITRFGAQFIFFALAGFHTTVSEFVCRSETGFFANYDECHSYYICAYGKSYLSLCPPGLLFNSVTKICDWPAYVSCATKDVEMLPEPEYRLGRPSPEITCSNLLRMKSNTDCQSFYSCLDGVAYKERCSKGLFFNSKTQNCDFPQNVECVGGQAGPGGPVCLTPGARSPNNENCSTYWEQCSGKRILRTCDHGHHYSEKLMLCIEPCAAKCDANAICDVTTITVTVPTSTTARIPEFNCPEADAVFRNPKDCTSFWSCSNKNPTLQHCLNGLHFSEKLKLCVEPCAAKCDPAEACNKSSTAERRSTVPITTFPPDVTTKTVTFPTSTTARIPEFNCPEADALFRNPKDCKSFWMCSNKNPTLQHCSNGLHFSEQLKQCAEPCAAKCDPAAACKKQSDVCKGRQFYPHEKECTQYYHCAHGIAHLRDCPDDLHWSVARNRCDWPCVAKCDSTINNCEDRKENYEEPMHPVITRNDICKGEEFYPHETDCTKYYHCAHGIGRLKPCPSNLHWSVEKNLCEWPCIAQCDKTEQKCDNTWIHPVEPTLPEIIRRDICVHEDQEFYGHPTDCTKFYHCADRLGYLKICPGNLHWSQQKNFCEWPCVAKCNTTADCGKINDQTSETVLPTIKDQSICKGSTRSHYPHKTDCNKFYQCDHGDGILSVCQSGLHWSVELNQCEWPCRAKCDSTLKCSTDYYENDLTVRPVPNTKFRCPLKQRSGLFRDPDNCKHFYHCSHGTAHHKWCPADLHFNARLMVCDWPDRAGCAKADVTTDNSTINLGNDEGTCSCECCLLPDEKDCQTYYICFNMRLYRRKCNSGLLYNPDIQTCDHSEHLKKKCENVPNKDVEKITHVTCRRSGELLNHETDCNRYYHCDNGSPKLRICQADLHFSVALQRCEYPCAAKCQERAECAKEQKDAEQTNNTSSRGQFTCPSYSGLFPDTNDCNKFFHCDHYKAHHKVCPSNLHFNPSLRVCDWPYRAGCINGQISRDPTDAIGDCSCECCLQADQHHCNKFTLCLHGKLYPGSCSEGLFFNPKEETCDVEEKVRHLCAKEQPTIKNACQCTDCRLPHPTDCTLYHQCSGGNANEEKCPAGQSFNRKTSECDQSEKVECPVIGNTELCSRSGMFKSPKSGNEYIICARGKAYIERCPAKKEFDEETQVCDYPKGKRKI